MARGRKRTRVLTKCRQQQHQPKLVMRATLASWNQKESRVWSDLCGPAVHHCCPISISITTITATHLGKVNIALSANGCLCFHLPLSPSLQCPKSYYLSGCYFTCKVIPNTHTVTVVICFDGGVCAKKSLKSRKQEQEWLLLSECSNRRQSSLQSTLHCLPLSVQSTCSPLIGIHSSSLLSRNESHRLGGLGSGGSNRNAITVCINGQK